MKDRNTIEERIQRVDQKIKAMDVLISKYDKKKRIKDEEREHDHFDMLSTSHLKGAL